MLYMLIKLLLKAWSAVIKGNEETLNVCMCFFLIYLFVSQKHEILEASVKYKSCFPKTRVFKGIKKQIFSMQRVRNKLKDNRDVQCISFNVNVVSINFVVNNSNNIIEIVITVPETQSFGKIKRQQCVVLSLGRGVCREGNVQRFYCNAGKRV